MRAERMFLAGTGVGAALALIFVRRPGGKAHQRLNQVAAAVSESVEC